MNVYFGSKMINYIQMSENIMINIFYTLYLFILVLVIFYKKTSAARMILILIIYVIIQSLFLSNFILTIEVAIPSIVVS